MSPARPGVCVFQLPTSGHVNPLLPVLAELADRGIDVLSTSIPSIEAKLTATGARVVGYPRLVADRASTPPDGLASVCELLAEMTEELLPWCVALLERERPAVVIVDSMAPWGRLAAAHVGIPCVSSSTTFVLHGNLDDSLSGKVRLVREVLTGLPALARYAAARLRVRRRWHQDLGGPVELLAGLGDQTIAHTSRELQPGAELFDDTVHYIGTAVRPARPEHRELADLPDGPLIYASLGTLYNERPDFFRAVLAALADHPGRCCSRSAIASIPRSSASCRQRDGAALRAAARGARPRAAAFITHGGMNSTTEALVHGVPMVFAPQTADQPIVAQRIAELGAGTVLRGHLPTPQAIAAAVAEVQRSGARERAASLGASLLACGGAPAAADVIMHAAGPAIPDAAPAPAPA